MPTQTELLAMWNNALAVRKGISIHTNDRVLLRQQLYRVRDGLNPEDKEPFMSLAVVFPNTDGVLWIVKKDADLRQ